MVAGIQLYAAHRTIAPFCRTGKTHYMVPEPELHENDWQCAYLEQFLNKAGTKRICRLYDEPDPGVKPCRVAFFIFKDAPKTLRTPYGNFKLAGSPMPARLKGIIEFEED